MTILGFVADLLTELGTARVVVAPQVRTEARALAEGYRWTAATAPLENPYRRLVSRAGPLPG